VADRLSFRRFCGFPLDQKTPDHMSIWRFRQRLVDLGLQDQLLAELNRQLDGRVRTLSCHLPLAHVDAASPPVSAPLADC
jgi:IS5 family transposase